MVKIFLPKGLSARVRGAIARRLQSAMAVRADTAETTVEEGTSEVPARGVEQADAELQEAPIPAAGEGGRHWVAWKFYLVGCRVM